MIRTLGAVLALFVFGVAPALADDARGTADAALAGTWKLTYSITGAGFASMGGHYVQVYSDGHVHWTDTTRDPRAKFDPTQIATARCEDTVQIEGADLASVRETVRAMYDLQLADAASGFNSAYLQVTITRGGRDYVASVVHYVPSLENLDPRLKRLNTIVGRYACGATPAPRPA